MSQHLTHQVSFNSSSPSAYCEYAMHEEKLKSYVTDKIKNSKTLLYSRSGSENMDIRFYIDTSYERRRTGDYSHNDSIVNYLNVLVNAVQNDFNLAAPNWDIVIEPEYVFFDGATPFSYGSTIVETFLNFFDWIDSQGYPGMRDTYVFYSGQYTNQGIAFLGTLCLPGGAMVGYVQDQASNEDLSSHEWIGHCANSSHFDGEINIMNSIAHRPWNAPSIAIIEDYLENQNCVINAQVELDLEIEDFNLVLDGNKVILNWKSFGDYTQMKIERKREEHNWQKIFELKKTDVETISTYSDYLENTATYFYRLIFKFDDGSELYSDIRKLNFEGGEILSIVGNKLKNPKRRIVNVIDMMGRCIWIFDQPDFDLDKLKTKGLYFFKAGSETIRWVH
ncbi:MAG: hypothetical protein IPM92_07060 [Saprospiraceae bacterium]|nr:hypothetical protein [Saprospiraceae bacterium]